MRTVKAITGMSAAERFYKKLSGAIRYMLPAATALAFLGLSTDTQAQTPAYDIILDNLTINENEAVGTAVGFIYADDMEFWENHTFTLVAGPGDDDNASFSILANKLQTGDVFNFEVKGTYNVRIAAIGNDDGLSFEKPFVISIGDVNDKPELTSVTRTVAHNSTLDIQLSDFLLAYADEDGNSLNQIEIVSLPTHGVLRLDATPVTIGQVISSADCDLLHFDAPDTVYGQVSFDWKAEDGMDYSDADGSFFIRVTRSRTVGTSVSDISGVTLPSGTIVLGHPGTRPPVSGTDPETGGPIGSIPGRRPGGMSADPSFSKVGQGDSGIENGNSLQFELNAYPNPFAATAEIRYNLSESAQVQINVYNYMGALVKQLTNGMQPAGVNTVQFGNDFSAGSYIYTVQVTGKDGQVTVHSGSMVKVK